MDLNGNWTLTDLSNDSVYAANVPGTVHTDLLQNNDIPDPFYGNNEHKLKYLEERDWVYSRELEWSDKIEGETIELVCDGLDTYAKIMVNGEEVGMSDNMHRQWIFDITEVLIEGNNQIDIEITSPFNYHKERVENLGYVLPADNEEGEYKYGPLCRKAAYHFGWDWAPRLVTSGIWKDIYLMRSNGIRLENYSVRTIDIDSHVATMVLKTSILTGTTADATIELGDDLFTHKLEVGSNTFYDTFTITNPSLWWSNGSGAAHLYDMPLQVVLDDQLVFNEEVKFGIRTIDLITEKDSIGTSFYFKINGQPIFAKGANYIPQDVFIPRVSDGQYRSLLIAAKNAGMNMIRVWGGGIYEKDIFYELCDSLGLMVWQDFMFAGTMYPFDDDFMKTVEEEAKYQINRLSKHPCLALWCGNNEIEVAWNNWGWQEKYNYSDEIQKELWTGYLSLFKELLPTLVAQLAPESNYTSTSPLSNWGTVENFNHGSMHYWGVWHGRENIESFEDNVGRFMVEYGMQSYPEMATLRSFAADEDLNLDSEVMVNRQKSYIGNEEILRLISTKYDAPTDFEDFVSKSQDVQAEALDIAIGSHLNSNGHCMGSLFWQLNDCWPGPSWSIIDYYGNRKKAYDVVKEQFGQHLQGER
jgi:beta-mannosidase